MGRAFITWHQAKAKCYVVPAVHFSHVFALEVNRLCSLPQTRPEAIAVELGPKTAKAARTWLEELGVGSTTGKPLPVMLGLLKRNQIIRGSLRQKVFDLQKETGLDLSEMSPELLLQELDFSGYSLLCLSPTDSIIEAIRCSVEWQVPLYGVDLEDVPSFNYQPIVIPDPLSATGNLKAYVETVGLQATHNRNLEIDPKRELVMAARLKGLMGRHKRILFTGGLAHWPNLQRLLADDSLRPALPCDANPLVKEKFERVIVHPIVAVSFMDRFPALVKAFETFRNSTPIGFKGPDKAENNFPVKEIFEKVLERAYRKYFLPKKKKNFTGYWWQDLYGLKSFEDHLVKYSLLSHQLVPSLASTMSTARVMMSRNFQKKLLGVLLNFPWVKPSQYPDYPMVIPQSPEERGEPAVRLFIKGHFKGKRFFFTSVIGGGLYSNEMEMNFRWERERNEDEAEGISHTWRPWDYLISSLSIQALQQAQGAYLEKKSEPFEYSLMDGIDIKSTLKAYARGEETIFVYDRLRKTYRPDLHLGQGFPVVWILEPGNQEGARLNALYEDCHWMLKYVEDKETLKAVINQRGHKMIALIGYGHFNIPTSASKKDRKIRSDRYNGVLLYQPIHFDKKQFAHWVEWSRYTRNPYCNGCEIDPHFPYGLTALFHTKIGLSIKDLSWETALILFALPFAQDRITVVAPKNYQMESVVHKKAREFGMELNRVPLELFKPEELEKMRVNHMTPAKDYDPECIFDESVEKAIGELQTSNRDLVPQKWQEFGLRT